MSALLMGPASCDDSDPDGTGTARTSDAAASTPHEPQIKTPQQALDRLRLGNARWVKGDLKHPHDSPERRKELAGSQHPFAVVICCIDSRISPDYLFDVGVGDIFSVRTAAHTVDDLVLGSLEYGPVTDGTPLVVIMGHQRCGAVTAAVEAFQSGRDLAYHLRFIEENLRAPYEAARKANPGDLIDGTVRRQTEDVVDQLRADSAFGSRISKGTLGVVGAYYSLDTGAVEFTELPEGHS